MLNLETAQSPHKLRRVAIEPVTRVEGHGKVTILLDDENRVHQVRLHIVEFRGFEGVHPEGHPGPARIGKCRSPCSACSASARSVICWRPPRHGPHRRIWRADADGREAAPPPALWPDRTRCISSISPRACRRCDGSLPARTCALARRLWRDRERRGDPENVALGDLALEAKKHIGRIHRWASTLTRSLVPAPLWILARRSARRPFGQRDLGARRSASSTRGTDCAEKPAPHLLIMLRMRSKKPTYLCDLRAPVALTAVETPLAPRGRQRSNGGSSRTAGRLLHRNFGLS